MKWDREIYLLNVDTLKAEIKELIEKISREERFYVSDFIERYPTIKTRMKSK